MSLMLSNGVFSQAFDAAVRALYDTSKQDISSRLFGTELYTEYEPDVPNEQVSAITGPGPAKLTVEGEQYAANTLYKDYPVSITLKKFTSELQYSEEDRHWLQKAPSQKRKIQLRSMVSSNVQSLYYQHNEELSKHFYFGFGTTNFTGGDGVALFSASHPIRATGSTQSNMFPTTHKAFSGPNLVEAVNIMNRFQNMNGIQLLPTQRIRVICALENQATVEQAINSMYGPLNANLGLNSASKDAFRARGVDIASIALPNIPAAYQNYWFVIDLDRAMERLFKALAWGPRMAEDSRFQNGTFLNEASTLFGIYSLGWQHVFGSKGDDSAV